MTLDELLELLNHTPVIASIPPVSVLYLPEDVMVLGSVAEAAWQFDGLEPTLPRRLLITSAEPQYDGRFPHVHCGHDPFTPALNEIVFERFEEVASRMLCQSHIANRITADATAFELIVLVLVDGLSYQDVQSWTSASDHRLCIEPCLVDVPTLTRVAFPNLIGDPVLAARLFNMGYHGRLGFTYWTREDNELTDRLFQTIAEVKKIGHFPQILAMLREHLGVDYKGKTYVQIVRTGLDGYAHGQKRQPPIAAIVEEIRQEFEQLLTLFDELRVEKDVRVRIHLTADHGILWRDEFQVEIVGNAPVTSSPRWCGWRDLYHQREKGRRFTTGGKEYYCLGFPKSRRQLRIDEQGVHGGISFQESVVPFVTCSLVG